MNSIGQNATVGNLFATTLNTLDTTGTSNYKYTIEQNGNQFEIVFDQGPRIPLSMNSFGWLILDGTQAGVQFNSITGVSNDWWKILVGGNDGGGFVRFTYYNALTDTTINPCDITNNGSLYLGTAAGTGTGIRLYGIGTSSIDCMDASKGRIEFPMTGNIDCIATGGGGLRLSSAYNVGFAYVGVNMIAQNTANAFGTAPYAQFIPSATAWATSSDERLKKDIESFGPTLDKVLALRPVSYKWKSTDVSAVGFVAQEVLPVMPELVQIPEDLETQFYCVEVSNMMPYLVKAIQEQQELISKMSARIALLEAK